MNSEELQKLFQYGGAPWSVKFYKEKVLTALTLDLSKREEDGIDDAVCKKVYAALSEALTIIDDIKDGGFFFKHFHQNFKEFRDIYYEWNGVKEKSKRIEKYNKLRIRKKTMFDDFYKQMEKFKKTDKNQERVKQFEILWSTEAERMDRLNSVFNQLARDHGDDLFINLRKTLARFN